MIIRTLFVGLVYLFSINIAVAQEMSIADCTDGIDNDGDGLIDLNDDDCSCGDLMASSLIPNPSFEEMTCCPQTEADLDCANDWIQASAATTDYVHTCGVLGNPFLGYEAPVPFPDGEGAIGFRDGKPGSPNFKEYTGACLTGAMNVGVQYRLDFFVGFHDAPGSLSFDMAVFATTDCNNLPFGGTNSDIGCPTNTSGWVEIGSMTVSGENEWKNVVFDFMADDAYSAIALGPNCAVNDSFQLDPYFYFDRLVLAERNMFSVPLEIEGDVCADNLVLSVEEIPDAEYQWFRNGVAIPGAVSSMLPIPNDPLSAAEFEALILTDTGCRNSDTYLVEIPSYETSIAETLCFGQSFNLFGFNLDSTDVYTLTTTASDGCDSIVTLDLTILEEIIVDVAFDICEGDSITINDETFNISGNYTQQLTSVNGCDSLINIAITTLPGFSSQQNFFICEGASVDVNGVNYSSSGDYQQVLTSLNGCDSILNIRVDYFPIIRNIEVYTICGSNPIEVNGVTYTESGEFIETFTDSNGCIGENIIRIEDDPICENCGSENPFASSISITRESETLYKLIIQSEDHILFNDIVSSGEIENHVANFILQKRLLSNHVINEKVFSEAIQKKFFNSKSFSFISQDWIEANLNSYDLKVNKKQLRVNVDGEFQMLLKQMARLKVGNTMSHM